MICKNKLLAIMLLLSTTLCVSCSLDSQDGISADVTQITSAQTDTSVDESLSCKDDPTDFASKLTDGGYVLGDYLITEKGLYTADGQSQLQSFPTGSDDYTVGIRDAQYDTNTGAIKISFSVSYTDTDALEEAVLYYSPLEKSESSAEMLADTDPIGLSFTVFSQTMSGNAALYHLGDEYIYSYNGAYYVLPVTGTFSDVRLSWQETAIFLNFEDKTPIFTVADMIHKNGSIDEEICAVAVWHNHPGLFGMTDYNGAQIYRYLGQIYIINDGILLHGELCRKDLSPRILGDMLVLISYENTRSYHVIRPDLSHIDGTYLEFYLLNDGGYIGLDTDARYRIFDENGQVVTESPEDVEVLAISDSFICMRGYDGEVLFIDRPSGEVLYNFGNIPQGHKLETYIFGPGSSYGMPDGSFGILAFDYSETGISGSPHGYVYYYAPTKSDGGCIDCGWDIAQ